LAVKAYYSGNNPVGNADPKADYERADELVSRALALDPNYARAHSLKGGILRDFQGRLDEANAEYERALSLDPAMVIAFVGLGWNYLYLGQFEKSLEYLDKAIRLSPHDPYVGRGGWYNGEAVGHFGLKQYDQTIQWARRAIATNPSANPWEHLNLIAALALAGLEADAREALKNYLVSVPSGPKTIAAWKAFADLNNLGTPKPRYLEAWDRYFEGLRKMGVPEE
jgi:tetratricopeptide (TPR) repeat protein